MLGGSVSLALAAAAPDLSLALFREGGGGVHCGMSCTGLIGTDLACMIGL